MSRSHYISRYYKVNVSFLTFRNNITGPCSATSFYQNEKKILPWFSTNFHSLNLPLGNTGQIITKNLKSGYGWYIKNKLTSRTIKDFSNLLNRVHCDKYRSGNEWKQIMPKFKRTNFGFDIASSSEWCNSDKVVILKNKVDILNCVTIHSHS